MKINLLLVALAAVSMIGCSSSSDSADETQAPPPSANAQQEVGGNKASAGVQAPTETGAAAAAEKPAGM